MKKITPYFLALILPIILFACSDEEEYELPEEKKKQKTETGNQIKLFDVKGVISGAAGKELTFYTVQNAQMVESGKTKLNESGEFTFQFPKQQLNLLQFVIEQESIALAFDAYENIPFLTSSYPGMDTNFSVQNSKTVAKLQSYYQEVGKQKAFLKSRSKLLQKMGKVSGEKDSLNRVKIIDSLFRTVADINSVARKYILEAPASPINQILVTDIYPQYGFKNWDAKNLDAARALSNAYAEQYAGTDFSKKMIQDVASWANQLAAYQKFEERNKAYGDFSQKIEIGEMAPDILMDDVNGNELRLSSLKGKVVLVDFWASWCGPCRQANPHVVSLYNKYKDQDFTVYSVSLDKEKGRWLQAIEQDGLVWPNHVSDLMYWDTPMVKLYKFNGIPFTVLLDKNGKIVGKNLRGEQLEQKLISLL